jgi:hypothetical protein
MVKHKRYDQGVWLYHVPQLFHSSSSSILTPLEGDGDQGEIQAIGSDWEASDVHHNDDSSATDQIHTAPLSPMHRYNKANKLL